MNEEFFDSTSIAGVLAGMTEDEMDTAYIEAIGAIDLADEQWDHEQALIDNDD